MKMLAQFLSSLLIHKSNKSWQWHSNTLSARNSDPKYFCIALTVLRSYSVSCFRWIYNNRPRIGFDVSWKQNSKTVALLFTLFINNFEHIILLRPRPHFKQKRTRARYFILSLMRTKYLIFGGLILQMNYLRYFSLIYKRTDYLGLEVM